MEFIESHKRRLDEFTYCARAFVSGSSSEIPAAYLLTKPTDFDLMMYRTDVCAVPKNSQPPSDFRGEVLMIEPEKYISAGYAKLTKLGLEERGSDSEQDYEKHLQTFDHDTVNGPAITTDVGWSVLTSDRVYAVQCPYWPPEAQEWRTRHRPHGWPSKDLIDQVVSDGCFLVGKSHPLLNDDDGTQWRYSFSKAEMRLISSWTDNQKYVYHVLRMIKSEFVKKSDDQKNNICTYHLKTQMFWACEEKPAEFWEDNNLMTCICELLTQIQERFTAQRFPNYFLRDCNIVEGIVIQDNFNEAMKLLNTEFGRSFLKSQLPPKVCQECRFSISLPAKIALNGLLFGKRFGISLHKGRRTKPNKVQQLIDEELDDLMNGIYNMKLAAEETQDNYSYYADAEKAFWKGIACDEAACTCNKAEVERITLSHRISLPTIQAVYESLENAELSTSVYERSKWDLSAVTSCKKDRCPYAGKSWNFPWNVEHGAFSKKWINPTHLLSAAYLCNLYLKTGNVDLCNELAREERRLVLNASFSELFPMIFCPELAVLFDDNIKVVLGFLWLSQHLLGSERNFEFCTCPLLFLIYTRIQSAFIIGDMTLVKEAIQHFHLHRVTCNFPLYLSPYHHVLPEMAWRILLKIPHDV